MAARSCISLMLIAHASDGGRVLCCSRDFFYVLVRRDDALFFFSKYLEVSKIVPIFAAKTEIMCTVTLSYDANNQLARQQLQFLLSTGLFTQISTDGELDIDYSDPQLYEENDLPIPSDRNLSLDELEQMVVADIREICELKDAV